MPKRKVAVISGGPSRERDVSLKTGEAVVQALSNDIYEAHSVVISMSGMWKIDSSKHHITVTEGIAQLKKMGIDVAFLAVHGSFGEDGTLQALLDKYGIPFTGSGVSASLLAMDKVIAGTMFESSGLLVPKTITLTRYELVQGSNLANLDMTFPAIVKPASQGSSIGVTLVDNADDLLPAIEFALEHDNQVLVQQYITGREVSCGVLESGKSGEITPFLPTELKPASADFFDYYAKYTPGAAEEITPPDMPKDTIKRIQDIALVSHKLFDCSGYSRTDMIVSKGGIYVIEINTLPGLTKNSILPRQAAAANMSFEELIGRIIANAVGKQAV